MFLRIRPSQLLTGFALVFMPALPVTGTVIFSDDFNGGASPQWGNQSGNWTASGGTYFAQAPTNGPTTHSLLPFNLTDFAVDVDVMGVSDGGIWLRANSSRSQGILLVIGGSGHTGTGVYWHVGPNYSTILNPSTSLFRQGDNIHVRVVVQGNTYAAYVNGSASPVTTLVNSSVTSGLAGLYDFTGQVFGRQSFDNFVLSDVAEPSTPWFVVAGLAAFGLQHRRGRRSNTSAL